jgi:hypothetical protein
MRSLPLIVVFLMTLGMVLLAVEVGYQLGNVRQKAKTHEKEAPVGAMVGATLGLLAFLLAFTFGLAANLFQAKREVLLDEANAIGTTWLRAGFLSAPDRDAARALLREYVDIRLEAVETGMVQDAIKRSEEIHNELWAQATAAMNDEPRSIAAGLYVETLNDVIDLHAKRVTVALRTAVPSTIWYALYSIAFFAFGTLGYHAGLGTANRSYATLAVAIIFSSVIWLIADLDAAQEGPLRVSQQVMIDLRNSMGP